MRSVNKCTSGKIGYFLQNTIRTFKFLLPIVGLAGSLAAVAPSVNADADLDAVCPANNKQSTLSCTANNVTLAQVIPDADILPGACLFGQTIPVPVALVYEANANSGNDDIATFVGVDGKNMLLQGGVDGGADDGGAENCALLTLDAPIDALPPYDPITDPLFDNPIIRDEDGDSCGDLIQGVGNETPPASFEANFGATPIVVGCLPADGDTSQIFLNFVVTWDQKNSDDGCDVNDASTIDYTTSQCSSSQTALPIQVAGQLTVQKLTDPTIADEFGFTADAFEPGTLAIDAPVLVGDFPLTGNGGNKAMEQALGVPISVAEILTVGNYELESITCTNDVTQEVAPATIDVLAGTVDITLTEAHPLVTCVFTNAEVEEAMLTLVKIVDNGTTGGTAVPTDFQATISPGGDIDWNSTQVVTPGTFTISESTLAGYTPGTWSCEDDGQNPVAVTNSGAHDGADVDLAAGDIVTCTITNTAQQATLTVTKVVENGQDLGTLVVSDFPLFIDATPVTSGVVNDVGPDTYLVSETPQTGYTAGDWGTDCDAGGNVSVALGEAKTCTITNTAIQPTLTVTKTVDNGEGAGTLMVSDFPLFIDGNPVTSGQANNVTAAAHVVSETPQTGYTAGDWGTDCDAGGNVTLAAGEAKTCTITNTAVQATLTVTKTVDNGQGLGTLVVSDFPLFIDGNPVTSGQANNVTAAAHVVSETPQTGYTAGDWGTDCDAGGNVTLAAGETKTCTITNTAIQPTLTVTKTVISDNGGVLVISDFALFIDGNPVTSGQPNNVTAAAHVVTETSQPGYTAGDWGGDCDASGNVTLAAGDAKTCTITNDDDPAHLELIKQLTGGSLGTASPDDWTLFADGPTPIQGAGGVESDVLAGTYALSESDGPDNYVPGNWSCEGGSQDGASITLLSGENATCVITNMFIVPPMPVPTSNIWTLFLLTLMLLATGWYFRPASIRRM